MICEDNTHAGASTSSTPKLDTDNGKYKNIKIITHQSTCNKKNTCQSCVTCVNNNDIMRSKAGSYLMTAKALLKKVNRKESSLSLINLK